MACYCILEPPFGASVSLEACQLLIMPWRSLCSQGDSNHGSDACGSSVQENTLKNKQTPQEQGLLQHLLLSLVCSVLRCNIGMWHTRGIRERMGHSEDGSSLGTRQNWAWVRVLSFTCVMTFCKQFGSVFSSVKWWQKSSPWCSLCLMATSVIIAYASPPHTTDVTTDNEDNSNGHHGGVVVVILGLWSYW